MDIAVNGLDITEPAHRRLISLVGIHSFSKVWQANADGVDLNHNYNANWSMILSSPAPSLYGGEYPESEPEVNAVADFVRSHDIDVVIAFHSQGREIYYDFDGMEMPEAVDIAKAMAKASGYALARPSGTAAYGGFKDWFIKEFGRAGYTVEIGAGKNPLPLEDMGGVYEENARLILECMKCVSRYGEE